jgi:hypothetical protein
MFEKIEKEIEKCCYQCKDREQCKKYDCFVYRIIKIMSTDTEIVDIDIDEFFEPVNKNQISIFDIGDE